MVADIIDGRGVAAHLKNQMRTEIEELAKAGHRPGLAAVLVGSDPASEIYVGAKLRQAKEIGLYSEEHRLSADISERHLLSLIRSLNRNPAIDGILVQLPLPRHINTNSVLRTIVPAKDVDGFHPLNAGLLCTSSDGVAPCTPRGILTLLKGIKKTLSGMHAVVVGHSNIVGKPMAQLLLREQCTVTVCHEWTANLPEILRLGDLVVVAVGRPGLIRGAWLKANTIVIDVGINRVKTEGGNTRVVGDVAFEEAKVVASYITPVPGGVGPMTIAILFRNTIDAARARKGAAQLRRASSLKPVAAVAG